MDFHPLFAGSLVRLAALAPDDAQHFARWSENDAYLRIVDNDPARPLSAEAYAVWEAPLLASPNVFAFRLRTLEDDALIGLDALGEIQWTNQVATLGIAIGDPAYWGRGYGSDAVRLLLRYAFDELNLERVSCSTLGYNVRAQRCFEGSGFVREGAWRSMIRREGRRYDVIHYGILRPEWEARYG